MDLSYFLRNHLKLRHIHVMLALDEELSVSRTATRINVTQAAVSRTLNEVEEGFGFPLFERHARGLRRTKVGKEIIAAMRRIVDDIYVLETLAGDFNSLSQGEIVIGMQAFTVIGQIADTINRFKAAYPKVKIHVRDGILPELIDDLDFGRIDLVCGRLRKNLNRQKFETLKLADVQLCLVAGKNAPPPPSELSAMMKRPWILPASGTPMRDDFDRLALEANLALPEDCVETNNVILMIELLQNSDRIALCPITMANTLSATSDLQTYPFANDFQNDPLGLIYSRQKALTPAVTAFLQYQEAQLPMGENVDLV